MHHPWRVLRDQEHITVHWAALPDGVLGATDGRDIWLEPRQLQVERRCTLAHEQAHIDLGHTGHQEGREEDRARRLAAERLINRDHLIRAAQWAMSVEECADELWVTPEVLHDRIRHMHPVEKALVCAAVMRGREVAAD